MGSNGDSPSSGSAHWKIGDIEELSDLMSAYLCACIMTTFLYNSLLFSWAREYTIIILRVDILQAMENEGFHVANKSSQPTSDHPYAVVEYC